MNQAAVFGRIARGVMLGAALACAGGSAAGASSDVFIAGVRPFERPAGAPVVKEYRKDAEWYRRALTGISQPYPWSLKFLEDQGPWYTPFIHPGMLPPYDIRGWHRKGGKKK